MDNFFNYFFIGIFALFFVVGAVMFYQLEEQSADQYAIKQYMKSHGATKMPPSWKGKVGKGI